MGTVRIKRAYEEAESGDGFRILVDRLWPRGVLKDRAELDERAPDLPRGRGRCDRLQRGLPQLDTMDEEGQGGRLR